MTRDHNKVNNIETFDDYKVYLLADITENRTFKGYQTRLAKAADCHPSFISQVLNTPVHLTQDHAARMSEFWQLSPFETDYFLALVGLMRASSPSLRKIIQGNLSALRLQRNNLSERFQQPKLSQETEAIYYSTWLWSAVHVLTSIPEYQIEEKMIERLHIPLPQLKSILDTLASMGLVAKEGGRWHATTQSIHLPRGSHLAVTHLHNWRQRAVTSAFASDVSNIHYSGVHALSRSDIERLRQICLEMLDNCRSIIAPSPEEEMICLNLDFFTV